MMEAVSTTKALANFYQTVRRNNPEDRRLRMLMSLCGMVVSFFQNSVYLFIYFEGMQKGVKIPVDILSWLYIL